MFEASLKLGSDILLLEPAMNASVPLATDPDDQVWPAWSPDGEWLAYTSWEDGHAQIYIRGADGTSARRATKGRKEDFAPSWSPDGSRIAFTSNRDRNEEIYILDVGSGEEIRVTHDPGSDAMPDWSPERSGWQR